VDHQLMNSQRDILLTFRTRSGEWADQARKEAKAVIAACNERSGTATATANRLVLIVKQIRENCAKTLDGIHALLIDENLRAEPDELFEVMALSEDIVALDKEMTDLVRATSAILQTGLRKLDE
jgi:hypothetical protein